MEDFENQANYSRNDIIKQIKMFNLSDKNSRAILENWIKDQTKEAGLEATPKGVIHSLLQEASLYFDAGYVGESIKVFKQAENYAKAKDLEEGSIKDLFIGVDQYGELKTKESLFEYFEVLSKDLKDAINERG